jgi:hypothetical protein
MQHYNLDQLGVVELDALLAKIATRKSEEEWKAKVARLEFEALDTVEALREMTGRDYKLMLGSTRLQFRRKARVRMQ